jgi:hypothetical protein
MIFPTALDIFSGLILKKKNTDFENYFASFEDLANPGHLRIEDFKNAC